MTAHDWCRDAVARTAALAAAAAAPDTLREIKNDWEKEQTSGK